MEEYRKGKGKSKGYGKGPYSGYGKGAWEPQGPKGHGKGYGKKGLYWFDQEPVESNNQYNPAWAFAVSEKPKAKVIEKKPRGPPGLAPPIITSISNMYEHLTSDDENCSDDDEVMTDNGKHRSFTIGDALTIATKKKPPKKIEVETKKKIPLQIENKLIFRRIRPMAYSMFLRSLLHQSTCCRQ